MNKSVKRWIIGVCVGMCIAAAAYIGNGYRHRNDKYARMAHVLGVDLDTWGDINRAYDKVAMRHTMSSREIDQEAVWLASSNREVRARALVSLLYCSDPSVRQQVVALIRTRLNDEEPGLRVKAIKDLKKLDDPNLSDDVGRLLQDPTEYVRTAARQALGTETAGGKVP